MAGRRNWLPRCGALTRRGTYCLMKPVLNEDGRIRNGRCRLHAGCSTGPRTLEGKARCTAGRQKLYNERRAAGLPCIVRKPKPAPVPSVAIAATPTGAERRASAIRSIQQKWPDWEPPPDN
jgi:hypothetical protein